MARPTEVLIEKKVKEGWVFPKLGDLRPREIAVNGRKLEVLLPIIAGYPFNEDTIMKEFSKAGFKVSDIKKKATRSHRNCWMVTSERR